jgi:hypothetical protein
VRFLRSAIAAFCFLVCGVAAAQEAPAPATGWTDPAGRFALDFASNGFTPLSDASAPNAGAEFEHGAFQRSASAARLCSVREERVPRIVSTNQGDANARLYARTEQDLGATLRGRVSEFSRARVDGISVLSFRLDTSTAQQYWRLFFLARNGGVYQVAVACGGAAPLTMLEVATMNETLNTLRFLPEASQ